MSLHGDSKAMNLALGSWVMVGVCLGLLITPAVCRRFGSFRVCCVCLVVDVFAILLMLIPDITIHTMYLARFLVGFFEACWEVSSERRKGIGFDQKDVGQGASHGKFRAAPSKKQARFSESALTLRNKGKRGLLGTPLCF